MKHTLLLLLLALFCYAANAQDIPQNPNKTDGKGLRQGTWTILYDADWHIIEDKTKASFYRLITYKDDKPIGKVYDMYANGKIQMETTLLTDRPQEVMHGNTIFYDENGKKQKMQVFDKGQLIDEDSFDDKGNLIVENWQLLDSLGTLYHKQKNYAKAFELWERAKLKAAKEFGKKHENYASSLRQLGRLFYNLGRPAQAIPYYQTMVEVEGERVGKKHADYVKALNYLAQSFHIAGDYPKAEALYLEALQITEEISGVDNSDYVGYLNNLGVLYYEKENFVQAEKYAIETLATREKLLGKEHISYAHSLTLLGNIYCSSIRYQQAKDMHEAALKIYAAANDDFYPHALGNVALVHKFLGNYTYADSLYQASSNIIKEAKGTQHPSYAKSLTHLASLRVLTYQFEEAEALYKEAIEINKKLSGEKTPTYAESLKLLANVYINQTKYTEAESLMQTSVTLFKNIFGENNPRYASALADLATFYLRLDDYSNAETLFKEALHIIESSVGKQNRNYAGYLSNLGVLYYNQFNLPEAIQCYQEAKEIRAKLLGTSSLEYANSLITLANTTYKVNLEEGKSYFEEAKGIYEQNKAEKSENYAIILQGSGRIAELEEKYTEAERLMLASIELQKEILGEQHISTLVSCNNLAILYNNIEQYAKAEALLVSILSQASQTLGEKHYLYALFLGNIALNQFCLGKIEESAAYLEKLTQVNIGQIEKHFPAMSEKEKVFFVKKIDNSLDVFGGIAAKVQNSNLNMLFYDYVLATKGILFDNQTKIRNRIFASQDSTLQNLYQTWQSKHNVLTQVYQMTAEEKKNRNLSEQKLEEEINQLEKEISQSSMLFAQAKEQTRYSWKDVQKKLKNKEAAIEIVQIENKHKESIYVALIITPQTKNYPEMIVLKNGLELEGKYLKNYQNCIKNQITDKYSYEQYWKPIAEKLKNAHIDKLYLSPDGVYNQLNLSTLQNLSTNQYIADEVEIQILGNTKDLITRPAEKKITIQNGVFFGYPDYDSEITAVQETSNFGINLNRETVRLDTTQRFFNGNTISELPGTKVEVENIEAIFNKNNIQVSTFLDTEASEAKVKDLKSPQILHIATHGFFLSTSDATANQRDDTFMGINNEKIIENPLLRSGLLLTGATQVFQGKAKEGVLTSLEVMTLDLEDTELVVMSACETGLGEISNGEGVYGLQRAFQIAGAKTVLMSLWTVSDEATKDLMTAFYENWVTKRQNKREAFNNAQKQLRTKYPEPYYWGAFVMVGE